MDKRKANRLKRLARALSGGAAAVDGWRCDGSTYARTGPHSAYLLLRRTYLSLPSKKRKSWLRAMEENHNAPEARD